MLRNVGRLMTDINSCHMTYPRSRLLGAGKPGRMSRASADRQPQLLSQPELPTITGTGQPAAPGHPVLGQAPGALARHPPGRSVHTMRPSRPVEWLGGRLVGRAGWRRPCRARAQLPDSDDGRHPAAHRDHGRVHLGHHRRGRGGEFADGVDQVEGHRDPHEQGEQAELAALAPPRRRPARAEPTARASDRVPRRCRPRSARCAGPAAGGSARWGRRPGGDRRRVGAAPVAAMVMPHRLWCFLDPAPPWRGGRVQLCWDALGGVGEAVGIGAGGALVLVPSRRADPR
jgi:hypothetical protein